MNSNKNIPQLRFPGFTGEWEEKLLEEICNTVSSPMKIQSRDYLPSGKYPVVDQSQSLICGWTNDNAGLLSNFPYILFGDHTCTLKFINFPFVQGADGVKILSPKNNFYPQYIYYALESNPVQQDGYKRHFSDLKEKKFHFPKTPAEQQRIAECLSEIDNLISAQGEKVDALKEKKKGMMQQMFPHKGETTPRLRFPGFTGEWVEKKFKEITYPSGKKNKHNLPYERYSISNEVGFYPQSSQFEDGGGYLKNIDCRQYIIVSPHSFAYNPARINVGSIGYQNLEKDVIVSSLYEVFQTNELCDDLFLWQWFHSDIFHRMVIDVQEGGVRQYFFYEKLRECIIRLPLPAEQKKITECLSAMDDMIASESAKLDALKDHKKGLMQQLFPQPNK